jgi:hypothetical protein
VLIGVIQKGKGDQCAEIRKLRLERELKRVNFVFYVDIAKKKKYVGFLL